MPWKAADAKKYSKAADTPALQRQWAAVANSALAKCTDEGGETAACEASAIKQANGVIAKAQEAAAEAGRAAGESTALAEMEMGLRDLANAITQAFYALFDPPLPGSEGASRGYRYWVRDVFAAHPVLDNSLVVEVEKGGRVYAVPYGLDGENLTFAPAGDWREVRQVYEYVDGAGDEYADPGGDVEAGEADERLAESFEGTITGRALAIAEAGDVAGGGTVPLILEIAAITPGWGNRRDNHYYPAEMLAEYAPRVLRDVKMYESNHGAKTNREWVSTILETDRFLEDGTPVSRVGVHDPGFAQRVQALASLGKLHLLECSILASGRASKYEEGGRKGKRIEEIYAEPRPDVDWVTRAGAGGRALAIAESGGETMPGQTEEPPEGAQVAESQSDATETVSLQEGDATEEAGAVVTALAEAEVRAALPAGLPQPARDRLLAGQYADAAALSAAVTAEVEYVKALTGSGRPWGQGETQAPGPVALTEDEKRQRFNTIMRGVGAREV